MGGWSASRSCVDSRRAGTSRRGVRGSRLVAARARRRDTARARARGRGGRTFGGCFRPETGCTVVRDAGRVRLPRQLGPTRPERMLGRVRPLLRAGRVQRASRPLHPAWFDTTGSGKGVEYLPRNGWLDRVEERPVRISAHTAATGRRSTTTTPSRDRRNRRATTTSTRSTPTFTRCGSATTWTWTGAPSLPLMLPTCSCAALTRRRRHRPKITAWTTTTRASRRRGPSASPTMRRRRHPFCCSAQSRAESKAANAAVVQRATDVAPRDPAAADARWAARAMPELPAAAVPLPRWLAYVRHGRSTRHCASVR